MKAVIIFYSNSGTTRALAERIRERLGCPAFEVVPAVPYGRFFAAVMRFVRESGRGVVAEYTAPAVDFSEYDTILVGYPVWGGGVPPFMLSYIGKQNLAGKTLIPFSTSGGTNISRTLGRLAKAAAGAEVKLPYNGARIGRDNLELWIENVSHL